MILARSVLISGPRSAALTVSRSRSPSGSICSRMSRKMSRGGSGDVGTGCVGSTANPVRARTSSSETPAWSESSTSSRLALSSRNTQRSVTTVTSPGRRPTAARSSSVMSARVPPSSRPARPTDASCAAARTYRGCGAGSPRRRCPPGQVAERCCRRPDDLGIVDVRPAIDLCRTEDLGVDAAVLIQPLVEIVHAPKVVCRIDCVRFG